MTYTIRCQDMDDATYVDLDDALCAAEDIWNHMTEKERAKCEVLEVWDDYDDEVKGPVHSWPVEGSLWDTAEDRIILNLDGNLKAISVPYFDDDVWEAISDYDV